jgi:hypothetical protein
MAMEAMHAEDAMHGQDQMGAEEMGGPAPLSVLQVIVLQDKAAQLSHTAVKCRPPTEFLLCRIA